MLEDRVYGDSDSDSDHDMDDGDRADSGQPSVLEILVNANPFAARIESQFGPNKGRLPLHLAVATGKPWNEGIKSVLAAFPEAISRIDPLTGLYPFLQAATTERPECGVILELLKKDPSLAVLSLSSSFGVQSTAIANDAINDCRVTVDAERNTR
jgi:hypothetical protein